MENNTSLAITPNTNIILLKTPFEMDEQNTLTFANATAQYNYFNGITNKLELENATYQRKDGVLKWAGRYDDIIGYNYCMYQNDTFSNKWFYAFIEDIRFVSAEVTEIKLKTDVFQTWQFDIHYNKMFVEREHVNDDTVGKHTIPENLETGEYVSNKEKTTHLGGNESALLVMGVTGLPSDSLSFSKGAYNSVYSGLYYLGFLCYGSGITNINNVIDMYATAGRLDYIQSIFLCYLGVTMSVATWTFTQGGTTITADVGVIPTGEGANTLANISLTKPTTLAGSYTPVNNKLKTYPYMYFTISNNSGQNIPFRYEDFSSTITFKPITSLTVGGSLKLIPLNYKGVAENYENAINGGKLPACSWSGDIYTNWLTQNAINIPLEATSGLIEVGKGLLVGSENPIVGASMVLGGGSKIASTMSEIYQHKLVPETTYGNLNSGDINYSYGMSGYTAYYYSIKKEYASIIDSYFSMYGYKVDEVKVPNIIGRTNWNFVKTINCNIYGDIPQKDLLEIKGLFDRGITFWHNPTTFLDYSQSNAIVN